MREILILSLLKLAKLVNRAMSPPLEFIADLSFPFSRFASWLRIASLVALRLASCDFEGSFEFELESDNSERGTPVLLCALGFALLGPEELLPCGQYVPLS